MEMLKLKSCLHHSCIIDAFNQILPVWLTTCIIIKISPALLQILADEMGIQAALVEKDYWIMHVLYGLKIVGLGFELKGGTSLSKGFQIIDRFSYPK